MKKILWTIPTVLLLGHVAFAQPGANGGGVPPQYLSIDGWEDCVKSERRGQAKFYCLPDREHKRKHCPGDVYQQLQDTNELQTCVSR